MLSHCPGTVFEDQERRSIVNPVKTAVVHRRLADQLWQADQTAVPIPPLTDQHPDLSIEDAYAIQSVNIDRRIQNGERICGRKIGLTSQPMQELLGVDEPDYGVLLDGMFVEDGDEIDLDRLVQPRVEAEMAFIMERDLEGPGANTASALRAIAGALPAVEIVDSRVADWKIKLVDTVADNASSGLIVMGGRLRRVDELDLRLVGVAVIPGRRADRHRRRSRRPWQSSTLCGVAREQTCVVRREAACR